MSNDISRRKDTDRVAVRSTDNGAHNVERVVDDKVLEMISVARASWIHDVVLVIVRYGYGGEAIGHRKH